MKVVLIELTRIVLPDTAIALRLIQWTISPISAWKKVGANGSTCFASVWRNIYENGRVLKSLSELTYGVDHPVGKMKQTNRWQVDLSDSLPELQGAAIYGFHKQTPTTFNAYVSPPEAPVFKNKDKSRVARNSIVRSHKGEMIEVPNGIAKRQAIKVETGKRNVFR